MQIEAEVNFYELFARKFILHSPTTATYYKAKYVKLSEDLTENIKRRPSVDFYSENSSARNYRIKIITIIVRFLFNWDEISHFSVHLLKAQVKCENPLLSGAKV